MCVGVAKNAGMGCETLPEQTGTPEPGTVLRVSGESFSVSEEMPSSGGVWRTGMSEDEI